MKIYNKKIGKFFGADIIVKWKGRKKKDFVKIYRKIFDIAAVDSRFLVEGKVKL